MNSFILSDPVRFQMHTRTSTSSPSSSLGRPRGAEFFFFSLCSPLTLQRHIEDDISGNALLGRPYMLGQTLGTEAGLYEWWKLIQKRLILLTSN